MPKNGRFPSKEADLNIYFQTAVAYLIANAARLLISVARKATLPGLMAAWNTSYPLTQNPDTRTKTATDNKNVARDALMNAMRAIYDDFPESILTDQDRNTLNIAAPNATRTAAPVPTTKPIGQVDTSRRLDHTIFFTDEDGSIAKPEGVRGCQIWRKIGSPAIDPSELTYVATDTRSPYVCQFDGADAGKPVYYWLRWENTRGEVGPWSDVIMATITG